MFESQWCVPDVALAEYSAISFALNQFGPPSRVKLICGVKTRSTTAPPSARALLS